MLSLTVIDGQSLDGGILKASTKILVVVRAAATNPTHPNVISVPTQRVPPALFDAIVAGADPVGSAPQTTFFDSAPIDSRCDAGHDPVVYATEALLARKLGLAEPLERGAVRFRAALRSVVVGTAVYEGAGGAPPTAEPIDMLNVLVEVVSGIEHLPSSTSSYGSMAFTSLEDFVEGVDRRDPMAFGPDMDPIELCVHGVCLAAAQATLLHCTGRAPFARADDGRRFTAARADRPIER